ncbi:MAG TPA: histidine kinase dimerization/phosphoacceptor domain -containing protein, partial [Brumimicrobium sp.]|nr:histidine kinase dimerization/phosphoacceptor domain -containing protein [Brumimicrobium sp.]
FYLSCIDEKSAERVNQERRRLRTSEEGMMMNHAIDTPKGNRKVLSLTSSPIFNDNREIIGVEGFAKDLTDEISGKKGLDNFFNLSNDLHCIVHKDRYFVKISPAWTKLLGYSEKEMLSHSFLDFIHPDDIKETKAAAEVLDAYGIVTTFENRYLTKSGEVVYLSWNSQVDKESNLSYCTARDITKTKLAQDLLLSDLSEKELLLREIHHRVKNNLQIISSLLSLQAGANSEHEQLTELYEDSRNRIKSMAAIHEMFYQSEELDKIEFGKYLDKLIGDLAKSITSSQKTIDLDIDVEKVYVNLDTAIPLGLLINEIITNSIKHGADRNGEVKIFVKLRIVETDKLELIIGDFGDDSPKDLLVQDNDSLGLMLIKSLVDQINGEVKQLKDYSGTVYKLVFTKRK